ncbi:hypothetical protein K0M31_000280 [Melipona bicolor]|uniref:Uncharacterized protein n=1 Tax=Melipona bicolor TaxID=60889 RepID=A0AA40KWN8_9HYME|nr:hypothetical protein K0M31_000280 [Melipona bicolor]
MPRLNQHLAQAGLAGTEETEATRNRRGKRERRSFEVPGVPAGFAIPPPPPPPPPPLLAKLKRGVRTQTTVSSSGTYLPGSNCTGGRESKTLN